MVRRILHTWITQNGSRTIPEQRARAGLCEGILSITTNIIMFVLKLTFGQILHSHALIADAFHSLSDSFSSIAIMIGLRASSKPPDKEHPFGHGQIEFITTLIMSGFLLVAGYEILKSSLQDIPSHHIASPSPLVYLIIVITLFINEVLAQVSFSLARITQSTSLKAEGHHHRSDALSSLLVILAFLASEIDVNFLDSLVGIIISLWIMWTAFGAAKHAIHPLIGAPPTKDELQAVSEITLAQPKISNIHDIVYHKYGHNRLLSVHIEISDKLSLIEAHNISEKVEQDIQKVLHATVVVHTDPINPDHPFYKAISDTIHTLIAEDQRIHTFYALRIIDKLAPPSKVIFNVSLKFSYKGKIPAITEELQYALQNIYPKLSFTIHIAPSWAYTPLREPCLKRP